MSVTFLTNEDKTELQNNIGKLSEEKLDKQNDIQKAKTMLFVDYDGNVAYAGIGKGLTLKASTSKNIFHGKWENARWVDGVWTPIPINEPQVAWASVKELFPVTPNTTYVISKQVVPSASDCNLYIVEFGADMNFIGYNYAMQLRNHVTKTYTTGENTAYIALTVYGGGTPPWETLIPGGFMIEKGTVATEYEEYSVGDAMLKLSDEKMDWQQGAENAKTLLFVDSNGNAAHAGIGSGLILKENSGKNIFHGEWVNARWLNGEWVEITDGKSWAAVHELFPVEPGTVYTISKLAAPSGSDCNLYVAEFNETLEYVREEYGMQLRNHVTRQYTTGDQAAFIALTIYGGGIPDWETLIPIGLMIEKGTVATEYEEYTTGAATLKIADPAESIIGRNAGIYPIVQAAARRGYNAQGTIDSAKQFTMLAIADVHHDIKRYAAAMEYMDGVEEIDCGICLGDMQGSYFADNDGTWFTNPIKAAKKKLYPVIGNHDSGMTKDPAQAGSKQQQFDKFFAPVLAKLELTGLTKTYYSFTSGKVTVVVLDVFDVPDTLDSNGNFVYERVKYGYSQEQVTWLVNTLASVPTDNHVLIALHVCVDPSVMVECSWTQQDHHMNGSENTGYDYTNMIPEIVDAWQRGAALTKEYAPKLDGTMPTLTVNADFTARGEGVFAGYIRGHAHSDAIGRMREYPAQMIYNLTCTALDGWNNRDSDLPRIVEKKSEDAVTVVVVDVISRSVKLVRIGSDITFDMVRRDMIAIPY